ncbi:hypothetical protein PanWU01x14_153030 [Parasponia andersonii]|uniref:Uncharacterized protein n=1 Tax=Parasponia andersonii TaxID=3476 RepID=A0A2P5CGZ8_PARAD|nr:hypothetical protein PanWU01x14_153030 [Parasponia andersonii]
MAYLLRASSDENGSLHSDSSVRDAKPEVKYRLSLAVKKKKKKKIVCHSGQSRWEWRGGLLRDSD